VAEAPNATAAGTPAAGAGATQVPTDSGNGTEKAALDRGVAGLK
jgi:hypothetical protein